MLWLLDVGIIVSQQRGFLDWLPLVTGPVALALVLVPDERLSITWRTGFCAAVSTAVTLGTSLMGWAMPEWGLLETACMLVLLARTCRDVARPRVALALAAAMGASVIDEPLRTGGTGITLTYPFLLTFAVGGAVGAGCYLRTLDARRRRTIAAVRLAERIQLARELHDFVAHHVTGIIAQAHAAGVIHESAPQQVGPILGNIAEAGQRTMDSMRRLIKVLREDGEQISLERPEEPYAELTKLVSEFSGQGDGSTAQLEITGAARRSALLPEVGSAVHRVVQEALTNVRRHAPGTQATVRVHRTRDDLLRIDVYNEGPERRVSRPTGGRGGYGLIGLRERVETVGGSLAAGPADDGGWWVIAHFPVAPTAVPSGAEETAEPGQASRRPSGRHAKPNAHAEPEPDMSWDAS
ncbi:two-component sensor histidine kinase [Streptomyces sp. ND05-3B]|nr:two-component sensor histidine kinase [Streptomyces caniscabiei]UJV45764.1 two-component sensor histidine kinase [Streptomyces sp. AMCC400023]MBE4761467.1 two-component sensor histidine kinase [Streptomyces caniscabiei]MBE4775463.1 two-component sensor histidine kinase [Streptomyces caniscabiei]MBE4789864.1 two-component sensor histidine kinase [Streptomyces caniscabiei]